MVNYGEIWCQRLYLYRHRIVSDVYAAQACNVVKLLAYAFQKAGTTVPEKIAQVLYTTKRVD